MEDCQICGRLTSLQADNSETQDSSCNKCMETFPSASKKAVRVVRAVRLPNDALVSVNDVIYVSKAVFDQYKELGCFEPLPLQEPTVDTEQHEDIAPALSVEEAPVQRSQRPRRVASVAEWITYAQSLGVDTKNLRKPEIIAACNMLKEVDK